MPFSLHRAVATFQRLTDWVLVTHQKYAAAYIDDIILYTQDWNEHLEAMRAALQELQQAGLTANPKKCILSKDVTKYLGFMVGQGRIHLRADNVEALYQYAPPYTRKQLRAFLGLTRSYQQFIPVCRNNSSLDKSIEREI